MDDHRRSRSEDKKQPEPAEGVRIIGADEAAEAMERGDVAPRRTDDELRYGDRPPAPPAGPRPTLRFPLDASADPTRIERPPVQPAPDPVTGPVSLPHWTEPPTGEVPAVLINDDGPLLPESEDDLDAWSSFATSTPRWRDADDDWGDDGFVERLANESDEVRIGALGDLDAEPSHEDYFGFEDMAERVEERTGDVTGQVAPVEPGPRWDLPDDDWSASAQGEVDPDGPAEADPDAWEDDEAWSAEDDGGRDDDGGYDEPSGPVGSLDPSDNGELGGDRNLSQAIMVGGGIAALAIVSLLLGTAVTTVLVTAILGLCSLEYFGVLRKVGWEAATFLGFGATIAFPLAVHWRGPVAYPLLAFLLVVAVLAWYLVGAGGPDPRVLEGSGATLLGVFWIGGLGSAAGAMLAVPDGRALLLTAVLATVGYDIAAYFAGRSVGRRPLSAASPNKTIEGLAFGMAAAVVVTVVWVGVLGMGPWSGLGAALVLGLGAAVAAPLGDLCQSLLKRDLGVKDMGGVLPGHGGVLDRFDSMLFVLPTVYWLALAVGHVV